MADNGDGNGECQCADPTTCPHSDAAAELVKPSSPLASRKRRSDDQQKRT